MSKFFIDIVIIIKLFNILFKLYSLKLIIINLN